MNNDPVNFTDPFGLTSSDAQAAVNALVSVGTDVRIDIYRNPNSYLVTQDRNNPQNAALDVLVITKQSTGEQVVINHVQTVSNYPLTKPDGTSAGNNVITSYSIHYTKLYDDCKSSSCPTSSSYIPPAGGGGPSSDPQPCVKCGKISCICDDYQDAAVSYNFV